jgi:hypothetical protein
MGYKSFFNPTEEFVEWLVKEINGRVVIEIGSGKGELLNALHEKGVKIIGLDPYVNPDGLKRNVLAKTLSVLAEDFDFIKFKKNLKTGVVVIVARPCHSDFVKDTLSNLPCDINMIYIGFSKNLELDFERDIFPIRQLDAPTHPDCNIVVEIALCRRVGTTRSAKATYKYYQYTANKFSHYSSL